MADLIRGDFTEIQIGWYCAPPEDQLLAGVAAISIRSAAAAIGATTGITINFEEQGYRQWPRMRHPDPAEGTLRLIMASGVPAIGMAAVRSALRKGYDAAWHGPSPKVFGASQEAALCYRDALYIAPEERRSHALWVPEVYRWLPRVPGSSP